MKLGNAVVIHGGILTWLAFSMPEREVTGTQLQGTRLFAPSWSNLSCSGIWRFHRYDLRYDFEEATQMYKRILCPVDGSDTSNRGMAEAMKLAQEMHAKIRFLFIVDTFYPILDGIEASNVAEIIDVMRERGKQILAQIKKNADAQGLDAETVMLETFSNRVAELIVEQAQQWPADLIVMGTHGRRGLSHLLMGSDAEAVIRTSPVPVLSIRMA